VAGRLQGHPRAPGRSPVRLRIVAAAVLGAALVASAVIAATEVLPDVQDSIARNSKLTAAQRRHAAGDRIGLRPAPFDAFRARLRPRERFSVDVPPGGRGQFATRGDVVRAYSAFYFLPAIEVGRAGLVFHYRFR
jgi:heme exporter protein D